MKRKSIASFVFMFMFLFAFTQTGHAAAGGTSIYLDGKALNLPANGQVQIVNGNVMIPFRVVAEELGFDVNWDNKARTVTIRQSGTTLTMIVNEKVAEVNGSKIKLPEPPMLAKDTTLVPMRFIGEQMGLKVSWDNETKSAYLVNAHSDSGSGKQDTAGSSSQTQQTKPASNSNSSSKLASVSGIGFSENRLTIAVDKNVTPHVFTISDPERLVIDLPQAKFAETLNDGHLLDSSQNGSFDVTDYPDVSKVRYSLFSSNPSTIRIVLDLNYTVKYQVVNENGLIIVDLNTGDAVVPTDNGQKTVVIDAGHGGTDPGASSVTKKKEKEFTLAVALKVEQLLKNESKINVVLTRNSDTYPTLSDRVKIAEGANADIFISIHGNAGSATASGVETYYTRAESAELAKTMHKYLVQSSGLSDRKVRTASLHVTRETTMPAVLLECGYLSNKSDASLMYTDEFQNKVAEGIVKGIKEYLGIS